MVRADRSLCGRAGCYQPLPVATLAATELSVKDGFQVLWNWGSMGCC